MGFMSGNQFAEVKKDTAQSSSGIQVKHITDELDHEGAKKLIAVLMNDLKEDNETVDLYLCRPTDEVESFSWYSHARWSSASDEAAFATCDTVIADGICIRWLTFTGTFDEVIAHDHTA